VSQTITWNGTTYSIPSATERNWASLSNFLIALGTNAAIKSEMFQAVRTATTTPVTVSNTTDFTVITELAAPGAVAVTLPVGADGQMFLFVDGTGDAGSNNITITPNGSETILGEATLVLNKNKQSVMIQYDATNTDWRVLFNVRYPDNISLTAEVTGILPVANGGTNSSSALSNNRVMKSSSGTIIEAAAITATRVLVSDANGIPVAATPTTTEVNYVSGVTSAIQDQINSKEATVSLTASKAVASTAGGALVASTTTSTELGYVNGVTSAIQTQMDLKAPLDSPTLSTPTLTSPVINTGVSGSAVLDEDTMSSDSDSKIATQQSIKAYVDVSIAAISATGANYGAKSADYTITDSDNLRTVGVTTSTSNRTITLPTASANAHRIITIKKVDNASGTVIVDGEGSEAIDGAATLTMASDNDSVTVICDGSNWEIIDKSYLATDTLSGLLPSYETTSFTADGGFTGGSVRATRLGNLVTMTIDNPTWSGSKTNAVSSTLLPASMRPPQEATVMCKGNASANAAIRLDSNSDGSVAILNISETSANTLVSVTSPESGTYSVSYVVA